MTLLKRILFNGGSLALGIVIALGFFYTFYDSDSLTADILQQQREQDNRSDILFDREEGQIQVFLNKSFTVEKLLVADLFLQYDDTVVVPDLGSLDSDFSFSYTQVDGGLVIQLSLNESVDSDQKLFSLVFDGPDDQIVLGHAELLLDGEIETLSIATPTPHDDERLH